MAQTEEGSWRLGAKKIGIPFEEYAMHRQQGEKWCCRCQTWKYLLQFGVDCSQKDGRSSKCIECRRDREKERPKGVFTHTEIGRQRIREGWEKRKESYEHPMKGKKHSEVSRQHMRVPRRSGNGRRGKKHTPETRAKISVPGPSY